MFDEILSRKEMILERRLEPGECVIFANRRVLHGRSGFNPNQGERHFKGTYVSLCDFKDKLRSMLVSVSYTHLTLPTT